MIEDVIAHLESRQLIKGNMPKIDAQGKISKSILDCKPLHKTNHRQPLASVEDSRARYPDCGAVGCRPRGIASAERRSTACGDENLRPGRRKVGVVSVH